MHQIVPQKKKKKKRKRKEDASNQDSYCLLLSLLYSVATFKLVLTCERPNWVWRQDHESGIVDAILGYQLFDQQVIENCFSLRIELKKQVKHKKSFYQWFEEIS